MLQTDSSPSSSAWLSAESKQTITIDAAGDPKKIVRESLAALYNGDQLSQLSAVGRGKNSAVPQKIVQALQSKCATIKHSRALHVYIVDNMILLSLCHAILQDADHKQSINQTIDNTLGATPLSKISVIL